MPSCTLGGYAYTAAGHVRRVDAAGWLAAQLLGHISRARMFTVRVQEVVDIRVLRGGAWPSELQQLSG